MLKKNVIANYFGQFWASLMGFLFIPQYIAIIGMEAYGLIGFFAMLQAWLMLLDMGLRPMLSREMANNIGNENFPQRIRDLLRSVEIIIFGIASITGIALILASDWLADSWLTFETLKSDEISDAFGIMALVIGLRFVEGIYRSVLIGLQKQVLYNILNSAIATLRGFGAVLVLTFISPNIEAFFIWQVVVSGISVMTFSIVAYSLLPASDRKGRFSTTQLGRIKRFAGGLTGVSILGTVLIHFDKIVLSRYLQLEDYGAYALSAVLAGVLLMIGGPISQAWFPRLSELYANHRQDEISRAYHQGAQLLTVLLGTASLILVFFASPILLLWTKDEAIVHKTTLLVQVLALGNLFNGLRVMPFHVQLAFGWTKLSFYTNLFSIIFFVPAILLVVPKYGAIGAASLWAGMNFCILLIGSLFMFNRILKDDKWRWYLEDILCPLATGSFICLILYLPSLSVTSSIGLGFYIIFVGLVVLIGSAISAPLIREQMSSIFFRKSNNH